MKLPRDIKAAELVKLLKQFGYTSSRQKGSHVRMTTLQNGQILSDIASHFNKTKEEIIEILF